LARQACDAERNGGRREDGALVGVTCCKRPMSAPAYRYSLFEHAPASRKSASGPQPLVASGPVSVGNGSRPRPDRRKRNNRAARQIASILWDTPCVPRSATNVSAGERKRNRGFFPSQPVNHAPSIPNSKSDLPEMG
jgi:hypothetical protein